MTTSVSNSSNPATPAGYVAAAKEEAREVLPYRGTSKREGRRQRSWNTFLAYALLVAGASLLIVPFIWMLAASLDTQQNVAGGEIDWTFTDPQVTNYPASMKLMGAQADRNGDGAIGLLEVVRLHFPALSNTIVVTVACIVGQVVSSSLVGFGFARFNFRGRGVLFMLMLSTMMLPAQVTMIPVFVLFRYLGMIDTFWPLIIPAWLASPFFAFMFRQFFAQVPEELIEAARMDGASNFRIYWQMMLPLSGPVIAIVAIFTFMSTWNDFLAPLIYLNSPENRTLALALAQFNGQYGVRDAHLLMAASFVTMLPCILLFFAAQKYFVESVATSGLKG
jgi:ABC-type glycerol-3-phosphate transport system permease component